jgi:hypothetical protein
MLIKAMLVDHKKAMPYEYYDDNTYIHVYIYFSWSGKCMKNEIKYKS